MGTVGVQNAFCLRRKFEVARSGQVRLADGRKSTLLGHMLLPFTVAGITRPSGRHHAPARRRLLSGGKLVRSFKAVRDPDTDRLYCKDAKAYVGLEVASLETKGMALAAIGLADASEDQRRELQELVDRGLSSQKPGLGCTVGVEHIIDVGKTRPIKQSYYSVSDKTLEEMRQVCEMLDRGVIEPSNSGWSSPVVMTRKDLDKLRFCIDFRKVNAATQPGAYPLPYMHDILRKLRKAKFISTLDLESAYHQIPLAKETRPITAFTAPDMVLYQFTRMPYGLAYAPAIFQRLIDHVIGPELESYVCSYLDDIIVTETYEEHKKYLAFVLECLVNVDLTINSRKCVFCKPEVRYLGVLVNRERMRLDPEKVVPIDKYPLPRNLKQLLRFL